MGCNEWPFISILNSSILKISNMAERGEELEGFMPNKMLRRSKNFTPEELERLCKCWVSVSEDPVVGTDQSAEAMWQRIHKKFSETSNAIRTARSLKDKFYEVSAACMKFNGCYKFVISKNQSGTNTDDVLAEAQKLFQAREANHKEFPFVACWEILRQYPKWGSLSSDLSGTSKGAKLVAGSGPALDPISASILDARTPGKRPMGRDAAKKELYETHSHGMQQLVEESKKRNRIMQQHHEFMIMKMRPDTPEAQEYFLSMQKEIMAAKRKKTKGDSDCEGNTMSPVDVPSSPESKSNHDEYEPSFFSL
jgi:hypothetical protein